MNILAVDDHCVNRQLLRAILEGEFHDVFEACDGVGALEVLGREQIDAVISDVLMPNMDGFRLCSEIRQSSQWQNLPIVIYTATYTSADDRKLALELGADVYLEEAAPPTSLLTALDEAMAVEQRNALTPDVNRVVVREYSERLVQELEHKNEELQSAQNRLQRILGHSPSVLYRMEMYPEPSDPFIIGDNIAYLTGYTLEETRKPGWWKSILDPRDREKAGLTLEEIREKRFVKREYRLRHRNGDLLWIEDNIRLLERVGSDRIELIGTWNNVTERKEQEQHFVRLKRFYTMLSAINTTIVRSTERQELFDKSCRIAVEEGQFDSAWIGLCDRDSETVVPMAAAGAGVVLGSIDLAEKINAPAEQALTQQALRTRKPQICNKLARTRERKPLLESSRGGRIRALVALPLIVNGEAAGVLCLHSTDSNQFDAIEMNLLGEVVSDIAYSLENMEKAEKLNYLAHYDPLTGLPNRALLVELLGRVSSLAQENAHSVALALIDLEGFQSINGMLGYSGADTILRAVAERLRGAVKDSDIVARVQGDVFAVVLPEVAGATDVGRTVEKKIIACLEPMIEAGGKSIQPRARIGISLCPADLCPADTIDPVKLLANAESALRRAKTDGCAYLFYGGQMNQTVSRQRQLEDRVRQAVANGDLVLHYQPKLNLRENRIVGFEAFLRWIDPEHGTILPNDFLPMLETTGLLAQVSAWTLQQAVAQVNALRSSGMSEARISVNISKSFLQRGDFLAQLQDAIAGATSSDHGLELEIKEGLGMAEAENHVAKIEAIRALGIEVAIDDFGTGYSSLQRLSRLPVSALKIDRYFIHNMAASPNDMTMVSSIVSLAHNLGLKVIAQGVENETQAKLLRLLKCDELQGYLISKPLPAIQLDDFRQRFEAASKISASSQNRGKVA